MFPLGWHFSNCVLEEMMSVLRPMVVLGISWQGQVSLEEGYFCNGPLEGIAYVCQWNLFILPSRLSTAQPKEILPSFFSSFFLPPSLPSPPLFCQSFLETHHIILLKVTLEYMLYSSLFYGLLVLNFHSWGLPRISDKVLRWHCLVQAIWCHPRRKALCVTWVLLILGWELLCHLKWGWFQGSITVAFYRIW